MDKPLIKCKFCNEVFPPSAGTNHLNDRFCSSECRDSFQEVIRRLLWEFEGSGLDPVEKSRTVRRRWEAAELPPDIAGFVAGVIARKKATEVMRELLSDLDYRPVGASPLSHVDRPVDDAKTDLPVDIPKYRPVGWPERPMSESVQLDEFAKILGLDTTQIEALCDYLNVAYGPKRMVVVAQAQRIWRKAHREGLCDPESIVERFKNRGSTSETRTKISAGLRYEVFQRDSGTCQVCGRSAPEVVLHVDHRIPRSMGGTNTLDNLQILCEEDNLGKGAQPDVKS